MTEIFVGIDGGGTRTTAVATDEKGRELARLQGGAGLVRSTEPTAGAAALADLTDRVLHAAGLAPPATTLCCALAGAGRPQDRIAIAAALQREAIAERVRVVTDADAAFHDAFAAGPGILLIAGTGSIALGRNAGNQLTRVGGWGTLLGDEGSGYAIGLAALRAAVRAHDGREPETSLLPVILRHLALTSPDELIHWSGGATKREIAALAPIALAAANAEKGDDAARRGADAAARELAAHVASLTRKLGPWRSPPTLALAGGLIAPGGPLRARLIEALNRNNAPYPHRLPQPAAAGAQIDTLWDTNPEPEIMERPVDAARGAATLAREQ
jgi:glucosamine kinase